MKRILYIFCFHLLVSASLYAQNIYQGQVKDHTDGAGIAYCAVGIKGSTSACLSNEDGYFRLKFNPGTDTLVFQVLGYKSRVIAAGDFLKDPVIFMIAQARKLEEVTVYGNDEFLYTIVDKCRKKLMDFKNYESKVYYSLQSAVGTKPVELLECYYNGQFTNARVKELHFKNGRAGIAAVNGRYFVNLDISKAFTFIDLINPHDKFPAIPFHFAKKQLKKNYSLQLLQVVDTNSRVYAISFTPKKDSSRFFKGKLWIDQQSGQLLQIELEINKTPIHPFMPAYEGLSEIRDASFKITKTYTLKEQNTLLNYIQFSYQLNYMHLHQNMLKDKNPDTSFVVNSQGLMYFYDYNRLFFLPKFEYDTDFSDYRKIVSLGYNEGFWKNNFQLMYSKRIQKELQYFNTHGKLLNFRDALNLGAVKAKGYGFEDSYIPWSATKRISLKKSGIQNDTLKNGQIRAQAYQLKAQIFLDVNPSGDTLQHYSATLLDVFNTFYNLEEEVYTNCFINIYFDLCEMERRKLELAIKGKKSFAEMDAAYDNSKKELEKTASAYLKEVERGKNTLRLAKWNDLVKTNLGIDNMEVFGLKP